jgi:hypothetical protein
MRIASSLPLTLLSGALFLALAACNPPAGQSSTAGPKPPAQPTIRDLPKTPVKDADDPINRLVANETVDGLVLSVTIDGANVTLDQATPARVRKVARKPTGQGDYAPVTAVGFAGGAQISQVAVPDSVIRALDDWNTPHNGALVRVTKRQVVIPLAAARALDTVEVTAPATGAHARLDVRPAYADYCRAGQAAQGQGRDNPMCPRGGGDQQPPGDQKPR